MMTLSYFIWIYLISYAASILAALFARLPVFSSAEQDIKAEIALTVISTAIAMMLNIIAGMFVCGVCLYYLNISTGRDAAPGDIFRGFRENPSEVFKVSAFLTLPSVIFSIPINILADIYIMTDEAKYLYISIVLFVSAVIVSLYIHLTYGIAYFVMLDFPTYSAAKILSVTRKKMEGQRTRLFMLDLRFVPMFILGILSAGIGLIWIHPLITESRALFFLNLMNPNHHIPIDERI